jgi:DNA-binding winged helix-turn-helix (wHTH) protein/TolB-like protein
MSRQSKHLYEFGPFCLDATERVLLRDGQPVQLTPKVFDTLLALIENSGHIVEKDHLMKRVWPDSFVEEGNLAFNISVLRKALGEGGGDRQFIETIPKRGYRFAAGVVETTAREPELVLEKQTRSRVVIEQEHEEETEPLVMRPRAEGSAAFSYRGLMSRPKLLAVSALGLALATVIYLIVAGKPAVRSIAVLPFKPMVEGGDQYLELGMADALIIRLSNISQITVRPTSAVLKYTDAAQDLAAAGRELGVDSILDGRVQRAGDKIRVTVQLVRVSDGAPLWADKFDESFTNIFSVQDSISERVAEALTLRMSGEERKLLHRRHTDNTEAYQAYLRGRFYWSKWSAAALGKAIENFKQALEKDPGYAMAYSGLADSYHLLGYLGAMPPREAYPKGEEAALKALQIDETLSEAHLSLAKTRLFYGWDWPGTEREIKRAIDLDPNYADAHGFYGAYLTAMGRFDEALRERKRAQEFDPLSPLANMSVGWVYFYWRRYDQAIEWYKKALDLDPGFATAGISLAESYEMSGMIEEAFEQHLKTKTLSGAGPEAIAALRQAYAASGIKGYWQKELELAGEQMKQGSARPLRIARLYAKVGDKDRAFEWMERAYADRTSEIVFIKVNPIYESLHGDPRFSDLMRRVGLTP